MPYVTKASDEVKTSDATLADDSELILALDGESLYWYECHFVTTQGTTPQFKWRMHWTGTALPGQHFHIRNTTMVAQTNLAGLGANWTQVPLSSDYLTDATDVKAVAGGTLGVNRMSHWAHGWLPTISSGNLSLQWAQNVSNAAAVTVYATSFLFVRKVSPNVRMLFSYP